MIINLWALRSHLWVIGDFIAWLMKTYLFVITLFKDAEFKDVKFKDVEFSDVEFWSDSYWQRGWLTLDLITQL